MTGKSRPVILVSNDDGIHAPGINALAAALDPVGQVWVVAPDRERSAVGHALTLHRPIVADQLGPRRYAVNGTPSDCVNLALLGLLPVRPHIVVAGVNAGSNLGDDVTYSGTVSAAMEGTLLGVPALAVSLIQPKGPASYRPAAARGGPAGAASPARAPGRGDPGERERATRPAPRDQGHAPRPPPLQREGRGAARPRGRRYFWIGAGPPAWEAGEDTDYAACHAGYVSVTPLMLDLTDYAALRTLKGWEAEYRGEPPKRASRAGRRAGR